MAVGDFRHALFSETTGIMDMSWSPVFYTTSEYVPLSGPVDTDSIAGGVEHTPRLMTTLWNLIQCHRRHVMLHFQTKVPEKLSISKQTIIATTTLLKNIKSTAEQNTSPKNYHCQHFIIT